MFTRISCVPGTMISRVSVDAAASKHFRSHTEILHGGACASAYIRLVHFDVLCSDLFYRCRVARTRRISDHWLDGTHIYIPHAFKFAVRVVQHYLKGIARAVFHKFQRNIVRLYKAGDSTHFYGH
jgi:hypothetical protein